MIFSEKGLSKLKKYRIEPYCFFFLYCFLFFLPLFEAPKNIFCVFFIVFASLAVFWGHKKLRLSVFEYSFLFLVFSSFFAGVGSELIDSELKFGRALNWAVMPLVGFLIICLNPKPGRILIMADILCLGALVALIHGFITWEGEYPELNSVGHVNQSALYMATMVYIASFLILKERTIFQLGLGLCVIFGSLCFQVLGRSLVGLGGTGIALVSVMVIMVFSPRENREGLVVLSVFGVLLLLSLVSGLLPYEPLLAELNERLSSDAQLFSQRDRLFNSAWEVSSRSVFGEGLGSFGSATDISLIKDSIERKGLNWASESKYYFHSAHGHNIFSNVLVERGWFGVGSVLFFFMAGLVWFYRALSNSQEARIGLSLIVFVMLTGLGQSSLHVEHGQLAFVALGMLVVLVRRTRRHLV